MLRQAVQSVHPGRVGICTFPFGTMTENGTKYDFDLLVIGAGSGGTRAARYRPSTCKSCTIS